MTTPLPDLFLYGRPGCHLCEDARLVVQSVLEDRASRGLAVPSVVERDIETDEGWHQAYLERIPVLELGGRRIELIVSYGNVRRLLADALDGATLA